MNIKNALVTGASRGIGQAIAQKLMEEGFFVIGTATTQSGADAISETLGDNGQGAILNVSDSASVTDLFKSLKAQNILPYTVINNAGITRDGLLMRMSEDDWEAVVNTNLTSAYRVCKACVPFMLKQRAGRIVNIASVVGVMGNPGQTNYAAAKAGMIGFSKALAREVASRGVTVNCIAPGYIKTDMTEALNEQQQTQVLSQIPLGRLGAVSEIAALAAFLSSDNAGYITGQTLSIDGGMAM